jgi:phage terminase large subunit GpA-like protein
MAEAAMQTAHAGRVVLDALESAFVPPAAVNVADWAAAHRWVEGSRPGLWDHRTAPYLREPMETLASEFYTTTALVGPGQCGKTAIAENFFLATIDADPAPLLWYMQTDDAVKAFVKNSINPLIEAHPEIKAKQGLRPTDDSLGFKRFRGGMTAQFLAATRSNLISKTARRIIADEWDAYDEDFGDPKTQLDVRRQTYGAESHLLAISHCDRARGESEELWDAGIMAVYRDSDRRTWWWPCPSCGAFSSPNPGTSRVMRLVYPEDASLDEVETAAALLCPSCGTLIADGERRAMNREGFWARRGQDVLPDGSVIGNPPPNPTAGFWIVGVMSPFLLRGIAGLARSRVEAERAAASSGDTRGLREVIVKQWGVPYSPPRSVSGTDANSVAMRAEEGLRMGFVPEGVRFLTSSVDVQARRFERLVRGWGVNGESWIVDFQVSSADTAVSDSDWDAMLRGAAEASYPLADGSGRRMLVLATGCDSGGKAGVTERAYAAWLRARTSRLARMLGRFDGREGWNMLLLKGASGPSAQSIVISYPDSARKDRFAAARGQIPIGFFAPNLFKDSLADHLAVAESGKPWCVHFPAALKSATGPHLWFEQLFAEQRLPSGKWEPIAANARNEALDLMVMSHVMAHLFGLRRLDWQKPPSWAAPWDTNSLVFAGEQTESAPRTSIASPRRGLSQTALSALSARFARRSA